MNAIRFIITVFILIIWSVIGFIAWIALLFRTIALYSGSLFYAMTVNEKPSYMKKRNMELERVIELYMNGFVHIFEIYKNPINSLLESDKKENKFEDIRESLGWRKFAFDFVWIFVFWISFFAAIHNLI
jgi:hypothetical protein